MSMPTNLVWGLEMPSHLIQAFVLQPVTRRTSYRLYVKGASLDLQTIPLSDSDKSAIYSFETLFTSVLSLFDRSLLLQYTRNNDFMISCVFRESVKFSSSSSSDIKPLPRPNKSVQCVSLNSNTDSNRLKLRCFSLSLLNL